MADEFVSEQALAEKSEAELRSMLDEQAYQIEMLVGQIVKRNTMIKAVVDSGSAAETTIRTLRHRIDEALAASPDRSRAMLEAMATKLRERPDVSYPDVSELPDMHDFVQPSEQPSPAATVQFVPGVARVEAE